MDTDKLSVLAEPFRIKVVESIRMTSENYRSEALYAADYNLFKLKSEDIYIDFLTDSGTSAMSDHQWAGMMIGDESYAGSRSWEHLERVTKKLSGMPFIIPTHQGRAAERILYGIIGGPGKTFLSNTHFDTTRANIEFSGSKAIDLLCSEGSNTYSEFPFKGNIDLQAVENKISEYGAENIGAVILTVTNNSSGGQPVSLSNAIALKEICNRNGIIFVIDGCRIAENSYFIKHGEKEYKELSYEEIAEKMIRLSDAFIMSAKKDALVNMGGLLALKDEILKDKCINQLIITEGFTTYGGLSGRDMEAIAIGLKEVFKPDYLEYRIRSTAYLGNHLKSLGIPLVWPIGGHAVYIDARALYPDIPAHEFPGQVLACNLYIKGGIRCVEIGSLMFGKYDEKGNHIPAKKEYVRLAIPRRVYTQSHIDYVIEVFKNIMEIPKPKKGYEIIYEPEYLRHFTAKLKPL